MWPVKVEWLMDRLYLSICYLLFAVLSFGVFQLYFIERILGKMQWTSWNEFHLYSCTLNEMTRLGTDMFKWCLVAEAYQLFYIVIQSGNGAGRREAEQQCVMKFFVNDGVSSFVILWELYGVINNSVFLSSVLLEQIIQNWCLAHCCHWCKYLWCQTLYAVMDESLENRLRCTVTAFSVCRLGFQWFSSLFGLGQSEWEALSWNMTFKSSSIIHYVSCEGFKNLYPVVFTKLLQWWLSVMIRLIWLTQIPHCWCVLIKTNERTIYIAIMCTTSAVDQLCQK